MMVQLFVRRAGERFTRNGIFSSTAYHSFTEMSSQSASSSVPQT